MKPSTPFLAFLLFFLFAFGFAAASEIIRDVDGNPLPNGGTYYLFADGTAIINKSNDVVTGPVYPGYPLTITALIKPTYLLTDHPLTLLFANFSDSYWVVKPSSDVDKNIVMGNPSDPQYLKGHFYFKHHDSGKYEYELQFCRPIGLRRANTLCENVVSRENPKERGPYGAFKSLVVTSEENQTPVVFKFEEIKEDESGRLSMVV